jgi:hypothetical protein
VNRARENTARANRVRVYLALTLADLDTLAGPTGAVAQPTAYAVTAALRRAAPDADEEELEYAALTQAATAAGERRGADLVRRVVGAADVDRAVLQEVGDPQEAARITLRAAVPRPAFVSLHVDENPGGDEELLWYDITELDVVRGLP